MGWDRYESGNWWRLYGLSATAPRAGEQFRIGNDASRGTEFRIVVQDAMTVTAPDDRNALLRAYASGTVTWRELRERGFDDYIQVLGGLGELGLRPPIAPMSGPNVEARRRGREMLARLLRGQDVQ